jgi:hypothetical protein
MGKVAAPNTFEDLLFIFNKSAPPLEANKTNCTYCGRVNMVDGFKTIVYRKSDSNDVVRICSCVDKEIVDFVLEKKLDVRGLTLSQLRGIAEAYFNGEYDDWRSEKS